MCDHQHGAASSPQAALLELECLAEHCLLLKPLTQLRIPSTIIPLHLPLWDDPTGVYNQSFICKQRVCPLTPFLPSDLKSKEGLNSKSLQNSTVHLIWKILTLGEKRPSFSLAKCILIWSIFVWGERHDHSVPWNGATETYKHPLKQQQECIKVPQRNPKETTPRSKAGALSSIRALIQSSSYWRRLCRGAQAMHLRKNLSVLTRLRVLGRLGERGFLHPGTCKTTLTTSLYTHPENALVPSPQRERTGSREVRWRGEGIPSPSAAWLPLGPRLLPELADCLLGHTTPHQTIRGDQELSLTYEGNNARNGTWGKHGWGTGRIPCLLLSETIP